jgi:hypothetical protein
MNRRQKSIGKNLALFAGILLAAGLFNAWIFHTNWDGYFRKDPVLDHGTIFKYDLGNIPVPDTIFFAGQPVPMTRKRFRKAVYKALKDRMKHRDATIFYLQQSARWLPEMSKILKEKQLPDDLKFIPIVESNLTNVTSARGAKGFWQLQTRTARNFGLTINGAMDQRLDPWASTEAASDYLKMLYDTVGSWPMVIGGYNMGMGGILSKMDRQNEDDFYQLRLGAETQAFLPKLIAFKLVIEYPHLYGYPTEVWKEKHRPFEFFTTDSAFSAVGIEQQFHLAAGTVKRLNPWLFANGFANPRRKSFHIRIR